MLKTRIMTALGLLAVFLPVLFYATDMYWALLTLAVGLIALDEWASMIKLKNAHKLVYVVFAGLLGLLAVRYLVQFGAHGFFFSSFKLFFVAGVFWVVVSPWWLVKRWHIRNQLLMGVLGYVLLAALWSSLVCLRMVDPKLLLALMATIWISDSAAYFAGKRFGKNKLAPMVSPGKTWEGVAGALAGTMLFAAIIYWGFGYQENFIFPLFLVLTCLGIIGDLFESLIKRQANVKDSGTILPGHGGVFDRIDALVPVLPIAILLIYAYQVLRLG